MNKINPFVLAAVLFAVLLISLYGVSSVKNDLKESTRAVSLLEEEAKRINTLKKVWDKANTEEKLKSIFGESRVVDKGTIFEVKANSLNQESANDLIAKTSSEAFEIAKLLLTREDGDSISLTLEIVK
jgi:hypothetical protein